MKSYPKIELHCHLDGSVRPATVIDIARKEGVALPSSDLGVVREHMVAKPDCRTLKEYLTKFEIPLLVMQTPGSLERIAYELLEDAWRENVKYMEVRFGPQLHRAKGLSLKEVIASVLSGMEKAENQFGVKSNLILSSLRGAPMDSLYELIEAGREFLGQGVVALDLCAAEEEGFSKDYVAPFRLARRYGYRITIHAGEACSGNNVFEAVSLLGAERIGHGVRLLSSPEGYDLVKTKGTLLEMCPTSNVQTKAVPDFSSHPIMDFMRDGIAVSIATDNRTVSATTMSREIEIVSDTLGMTAEEYGRVYRESIAASFADDAVKEALFAFEEDIYK